MSSAETQAITAAGRPPKVAVTPSDRQWLADAVAEGGGELCEPGRADALVWTATADPTGLLTVLEAAPGIRWVQLPWAGIEPYAEVIDDLRVWTCAKAVYGEAVAEHVLALILSAYRELPRYFSARTWLPGRGRNFYDQDVTVVGGGGITEAVISVLKPFRPRVTVVRRSGVEIKGADRVVGPGELHTALSTAEVVVLAVPVTPETIGLIGAEELRVMREDAWLVNVARGAHVLTDDLVDALRSGVIAGAALDVTDPEPLPDGHPLWGLDNCIITPHIANTFEMGRPKLIALVAENVRRFTRGEQLLGVVDPETGY